MYIYIYIAGAFDKCADLSPHAGYVVVLVNNGIALEKRRKIKEKKSYHTALSGLHTRDPCTSEEEK